MAASTTKKHSRYINPATDFGFKMIFKDEDITREFLNDLLHTRTPDVNIAKVTITDGEFDESDTEVRRVVYDVFRQDSALYGSHYISQTAEGYAGSRRQ